LRLTNWMICRNAMHFGTTELLRLAISNETK
jgi:hypothetical protein